MSLSNSETYIRPLWNHYQSEIENYLEWDNNINEYRMIADERYRDLVYIESA